MIKKGLKFNRHLLLTELAKTFDILYEHFEKLSQNIPQQIMWAFCLHKNLVHKKISHVVSNKLISESINWIVELSLPRAGPAGTHINVYLWRVSEVRRRRRRPPLWLSLSFWVVAYMTERWPMFSALHTMYIQHVIYVAYMLHPYAKLKLRFRWSWLAFQSHIQHTCITYNNLKQCEDARETVCG